MVRIENPKFGKRAEVSVGAAEHMILNGTAVGTVRVNGILGMIRLTGVPQNVQRETARGYDAINDSFFQAAAHIPIIAPEKMIREEKSSREWSYRAGAGGFKRRGKTCAEGSC